MMLLLLAVVLVILVLVKRVDPVHAIVLFLVALLFLWMTGGVAAPFR